MCDIRSTDDYLRAESRRGYLFFFLIILNVIVIAPLVIYLVGIWIKSQMIQNIVIAVYLLIIVSTLYLLAR